MVTQAKNVSTKCTTKDKGVFSEDVSVGFSVNLYLVDLLGAGEVCGQVCSRGLQPAFKPLETNAGFSPRLHDHSNILVELRVHPKSCLGAQTLPLIN
jgi:hypothetical protein